MVNWTLFRRHWTGDPADSDLLQHVRNSAMAATIVTRLQIGHPVPDLRQLHLQATRQRAERRAICTAYQDWTIYRRLDAGPSLQQPILAVAVSLGLTKTTLATLPASHFASQPAVPSADPASMVRGAASHNVHHLAWTLDRMAALCNKPFQLHKQTKAFDLSRRHSGPEADGITFQMLRNLADTEKVRLLDCLNAVWSSGQLPESWLTAIVVPILKA
ncbi:hypothetical protein HPB49_010468 [Dermacentor silvarum]|uniref:Uncharacterized protein n=1 Tax=Dermacentor silvarum TaxID=543639 RepID=A0ACB8D4M7_DERSI|nr:hypothetical protein HPB49_010468 [Dermacentor silvarum]